MSEMQNPSIPFHLISLLLLKWKSLSHVRLCNPMYYTVHGILQARILEWEAIPFSNPGTEPWSPAFQADFFTNWAIREAHPRYPWGIFQPKINKSLITKN